MFRASRNLGPGSAFLSQGFALHRVFAFHRKGSHSVIHRKPRSLSSITVSLRESAALASRPCLASQHLSTWDPPNTARLLGRVAQESRSAWHMSEACLLQCCVHLLIYPAYPPRTVPINLTKVMPTFLCLRKRRGTGEGRLHIGLNHDLSWNKDLRSSSPTGCISFPIDCGNSMIWGCCFAVLYKKEI